jgi:tetraacyldisaccharide 4'-kinase
MSASPSLLPPALRWAGPFLAAGYGLGACLHRTLSTPRPSPLPTICIGNITVGGTGKTPAAKYFARGLAQRGRKPAVLMRGYKGQASDEAVEIESALADLKVPVLIGADRLASAARAKEQGCDIALLDDGFQHWRLARDLDIVLVDATNPFGGNHLAPWGRLREKPAALARAGVVIITRADTVSPGELATLEKTIERLAPQTVRAKACHKPSRLRAVSGSGERPVGYLRGRRVLGMCAIGNPDAFLSTLKSVGAEVVECQCLGDHALFSAELLAAARKSAERVQADVVVTAKDAGKVAKIMAPAGEPVWCLEVEFSLLSNDDAVWSQIDEALASGDKRTAR